MVEIVSNPRVTEHDEIKTDKKERKRMKRPDHGRELERESARERETATNRLDKMELHRSKAGELK